MTDLVIASNNAHKVDEVRAILKDHGIRVISLKDCGITEEIEETGETLRENAAIKADYVFNKTGKSCIADDSGLEVEALNGAPGVYSARYSGIHGDYTANNEKLLRELSGIGNRNARFKTVIAYRTSSGCEFFEGTVQGQITTVPMGDQGFGYDPVFIPDGHERTFAQMDPAEKNGISHRKRAIDAFISGIRSRS